MMNDRIKHFFNEATFDETRIVSGIYNPYIPLQIYGEPTRYSITVDQYQKFAELIIRECIKICSDINADTEIDLGDGAFVCMLEIKEHFGIKE